MSDVKQPSLQIPSVAAVTQELSKKAKGDRVIWGLVIVLALISVMVVYSAIGSLAYKMNRGNTEAYLIKQLFFIGLGLGVIYVLHRINYTIFSRLATVFYVSSILLLLYTLFFGAKINEGSRWVMIPFLGITFQSSDFAKLALYIYLSRNLSKLQNSMVDFRTVATHLFLPIGITCVCIMPANLSNALLTGATGILLLFIGRVPFKYLLALSSVVLLPAIVVIGLALHTHQANTTEGGTKPSVTFIKSLGRVGTWTSRVHDFIYAAEANEPYQVQQAKMAIANGDILWGKGPGNSEQRNFLPQAYNDFIYSIIIEEYGIIGGAFIMLIYFMFLFRCIQLFKRCAFAFGAFLCIALSFTLVIQALANMAVNVNIVPVTGVTLPLVSMGGTSFIFTCAAIGIILSVARNIEQVEGKEAILDNEKPVVAAV
jgi:cell division protein FtsW